MLLLLLCIIINACKYFSCLWRWCIGLLSSGSMVFSGLKLLMHLLRHDVHYNRIWVIVTILLSFMLNCIMMEIKLKLRLWILVLNQYFMENNKCWSCKNVFISNVPSLKDTKMSLQFAYTHSQKSPLIGYQSCKMLYNRP